MTKYTLPNLSYDYNALEPHISKQLLTIHHQKHHQAYVNGANTAFDKLTQARQDKTEIDIKAALKNLSWNLGGHVLHSMFWSNLIPTDKTKGKPDAKLLDMIERDFTSFERFKNEFTQCAMTVEGSGWAALTYDKMIDKLLIMQIEKHNTNIYPALTILIVLDCFEHAYYLDYKNEKAKFFEAFWQIVNWEEVNKRLEEVAK